MKDMLVRLLELPEIHVQEKKLLDAGILFRRPIAPEKAIVCEWVKENFSAYWASEAECAFSHLPVSCLVAQKGNELLGFACYETTNKNFFGPTGILEAYRNLGIGKVLLIKSLLAMREYGYAYAIIGGVGPESYYEKTVNATVISGSENSIYNDLLRQNR